MSLEDTWLQDLGYKEDTKEEGVGVIAAGVVVEDLARVVAMVGIIRL